MAETMYFSGTLVVTTCWCGITHGVPQDLYDFQRRQHDNGTRPVTPIHCPLGHTHVPAGTPRTQKLERQLAQERDATALARADRDQAEASARAYKGAATRARRRAGAGVCPCCNRSFKQLARHMRSKHPDFDAEKES